MTKSVFLAGWEVHLNGDQQCENFISTQITNKRTVETLYSGIELVFENDKLIRNYLNNVGLIHERKGNYNIAMEYYHRALSMVDEKKNKATASILLNNIGLIHSHEGDYQKALQYLEKSLSMEREMEN